jgi:hypothetical protein
LWCSIVDMACGNVAGLCGNELCWTAIPGFSPLAVTVYFIMATASGGNTFRTVECTDMMKLHRPPPRLFFPSYLLSEHVTVFRKAASRNFLTPHYL